MSAVDNIKLDNRIVGGLQSVITAKDVLNPRAADRLSLVGVTGYAADNIASFSDLNNPVVECVEVRPGQVYPFYCIPIDAPDPDRVTPYQFFIRESHVLIFREEKPKARAFTKDEFEERFKVGDPVRYYVYGGDVILTGQIVCYTFIPEDPDRSLEIYIAGMRGPHKAEWLFSNVRYQPKGSDHFIPFGVEGA